MGRRYAGETAAERTLARRERLLQAALVVVGDEGFRAATLRKICAEAGLTQRYYYEAFSDSEDMLAQLYAQQIQRIYARVSEALAGGETLTDKVDVAIRAYLSILQEEPRLARVTLSEILGVSPQMDEVYRSGAGRFVEWSAELARRATGDPKGIDLEIVAVGAIGAVTFIGREWMLSGYERPLDEVTASAAFMLRAIGGGLLGYGIGR